jgi:UDP-glucose/GDP-mannose dehydrogenase family, UDP binding domain
MRRPPNRSATWGSLPAPELVGTAFRSTPPTFPGECSALSAGASASWNWPTTSTGMVHRLMLGFNTRGRSLRGARILLLGLAYKKNTGDARESPAVRVAQLLTAMGADVHAADPHVADVGSAAEVSRVELTVEEIARADAAVLLTEHDVFDYTVIGKHARYILDCRHRLVGFAGATVEML